MRTTSARGEPLTVFIHVPKTAGTTFAEALRETYSTGRVGSVGNVFKGSGGLDPRRIVALREAGAELTQNLGALTGHLPFGIRSYLPPGSRFVTFLRDPVERTLSHFHRVAALHRPEAPANARLLEALHADGTLWPNLQTRMLSDVEEPFGEVTPELLEQAKANLAGAFVGFGLVERFDESFVLLQRRLGLRSVLFGMLREAQRPRGASVPVALRRAAERLNEYDGELYRFAAELFEQAVAAEGVEFAVELAALRAVRTGGSAVDAPPAAARREQLWELLVRSRAALYSSPRPAGDAVEPADTTALPLRPSGRPRLAPNLVLQRVRVERQRERLERLEAIVAGADGTVPPVARDELSRLRMMLVAVDDELRSLERRRQGSAGAAPAPA